jgi:hypothetical protein
MNRQIKNCTFNVVSFDGSNTVAVAGFPVTVALSGGSLRYEPYFHTGQPYDEAITGALRSQYGGVRFKASLMWDRLINTTPLLSVLNNAYTTTNAEITVQFHPDATNTTFFENVVVSQFLYDSRIESTIMRQPIAVELTGKEIRASIPTFYQL